MKPITSHDAHQAALKRIETLWDAEPQTPEGDELEALITAVNDFEDRHYPIDAPTLNKGFEVQRNRKKR